MTDHQHSHEHGEPRFPLALFTFTTVLQLAIALGAVWWLAPQTFTAEIHQPGWIVVGAIFWGIPLSLFEYMYHRYLLHSAVLPFLGRMHKAHSTHHGLTSVKAPVRPGEPERLVPVKSEYPVEHEEQEESMMFPCYAQSIFYAMFLVLFALPAKLLLPGAPSVLSVIFSVTLYYSAYELWHAVLHLPFDKYWRPLMEGKTFGKMTRYIYSFHLMHHWRPTANVAVVGFWGVAAWDHIFRTHKRPTRLPLNQAEVNYKDAALPKPLWPVSTLDRLQPKLYKWSRSVEKSTISIFKRS